MTMALLLAAGLALAAPAPNQALPEKAPSASTAVEQMRTRLAAGDADAAIALGERETRRAPNDADVWNLLGQAYGAKAQSASMFSALGFAKKTKAAFEKAVELAPKNVDARASLLEYLVEAPGYAGGSLERAGEQATEIMKLDPARGHAAFASIAVKKRDYAVAEAQYRKALEAAPGSVDTRVALGNFLAGRKRFADARDIWQKALADPELAMMAHYQLGKLCIASDSNLEEGLAHFKAYLGRPPKPNSPSWADAEWRSAQIYEKLGKKAEAVTALKAALRFSPAHERAKKDLKRLGG